MTDKIETGKIPTPGSPAAGKLGCTCPVLDNARGTGYMGQTGIFWVAGDCPLHVRKTNSEGDTL